MAASDFFSRWSKRPPALPAGETLAGPACAPEPTPTVTPSDTATGETAEPPTLERARQLTPQDDFRPFVQTDVDPMVRNTAMRQLFSDPHFNVMDGLDIYIDDYNTPNPLPVGDISRMAGASILRLIQSEPSTVQTPDLPAPDAAVDGAEHPPPPTEIACDDPDLRLQPNPDPGPRRAEPGPV